MPKSPRLSLVACPLAGLLTLATVAGCQSKPLEATERAPSDGASAAGGQPAQPEPTTLAILTRAHISSDPEAEHHQLAEGDVDFGTEEVARATLRVTLESPCFPFETWSDQGVPSGQRWPALCDAFDRGLSVTLDPTDDAGDASAAPALELLRAVTPFGGPFELESDVTDVVNGLPGEHRLRLKIDTWPDPEGMVSGAQGEWIASVELNVEAGSAPRSVLAVLPLVYESQTEPEAAELSFETPAGTGSARLEYRVTGHGSAQDLGCIGPAEEFCRRNHELRLEGELIELMPWRSDCAELCTLTESQAALGPRDYCAENPCGAPESVRAPRANWCPGSMTPPFVIERATLASPGQHLLVRRIPELRAGGSWMVSLSYFAFE